MRFGIFLVLALTLLIPIAADAQVVLPTVPSIVPCPVSIIPCGSGGAAGAAQYLIGNIFPAARVIFLATAILMFMIYALRLIFDPDSSDTSSSTKLAYGYGIIACAIVGIATFIVEAVGQDARSTLVNQAPLETGIGNIILFMKLIVAALVSLFLVIQGIRLIVKQGSEEEFANARTQFIHTVMGIAVILVANVLVTSFFPGTGSTSIAIEIIGMVNFALTILGALAVICVIIAGIMLVISIDESLQDRAKKAIFTAIIALIVLFCAYAIVNFFINVGNGAL